MEPPNMTASVNLSAPSPPDGASDVAASENRLNLVTLCGLACIALYGIFGNLLIIGTVACRRRLRKRSNIFVTNLAIVDLLVCVYVMPLALLTSQLDAPRVFGDMFCQLNAFAALTCCYASIQTTMLIAIERYFHICRAAVYRKVFVPKCIAVVVVCSWLYAVLWSSQGFTGWTRYRYNAYTGICFLDLSHSISYNISVAVVVIIVPLLVTCFCYVSILTLVCKNRLVMRNHRNHMRKQQTLIKPARSTLLPSQRAERKGKRQVDVFLMLVTIVVLLSVFWLPAAVVLLANNLIHVHRLIFTIALWLAFINSASNSLVYGILNRNFRTVYVTLLNKLCCCRDVTEERVHCELSNLRPRDQLNSSYNTSHAIGRRSTSPSTGGYNLWTDTSQSRGSDTDPHQTKLVCTQLESRVIDECITGQKYGTYLAVPSRAPPRKLPVTCQHQYGDSDATACILGDGGGSCGGGIPSIHVLSCSPVEETGPVVGGVSTVAAVSNTQPEVSDIQPKVSDTSLTVLNLQSEMSGTQPEESNIQSESVASQPEVSVTDSMEPMALPIPAITLDGLDYIEVDA